MRIICLLVILFMQLNANDDRFTEEENRWMQENPVITYVGDSSWLPFEGYDEKGEYIGLVPDLLKLASKNSPLQFNHIKTKSWEESLSLIQNDKVMMISQSHQPKSKSSLLFTQTYLRTPVVIVMQRSERYVSSLHQIRDKKIGLITNATTTPLLKKAYPMIDFVLYENTEDGLKSLSLGKVDAFLGSLSRVGYKLSKMKLTDLRIVGKTEFQKELGFGVHQNHPILQQILNKMIANSPEVAVQSILANWTRQEYIVDYTSLYVAVLVFTLIVAIITLVYFRFQRESKARIEAQNIMLLQQSKMASMGEMMDAVAHQWKQPLNALTMYSDLFKSDFEEGNVDKAYVNDMLAGVYIQIEHMIHTLSEFRNFFRPNTELVSFNLLNSIDSVLFLVKDEFIKHSIALEIDIDQVFVLQGNENEFKHLILNIINNAKDAFNENKIENRIIRIKSYSIEDGLCLEIIDNAGGIPEDVIEHIFEANVTTKEVGKGTGIGLYMSEQIVKKMGGNIEVSNTSEGACFKIEFKLSAA